MARKTRTKTPPPLVLVVARFSLALFLFVAAAVQRRVVLVAESFSIGRCPCSSPGSGARTATRSRKEDADANTDSEKNTFVREWIETAIEAAASTNRNNNNNNNTEETSFFFSKIETRFFLLDTKHPGNVGSSARSIKTMGFAGEEGQLVVVAPHDGRVLGRKKCIEASSGARDVLEEALLVVAAEPAIEAESSGGISEGIGDSENGLLERALREAFFERDDDENNESPVLVCGTGMPVDMSHERISLDYLEPRRFFDALLSGRQQRIADKKGPSSSDRDNDTLRIAFLFGNERYGMKARDMARCDVMLGIPTNPEFGSLNLATAVQIIAYDWRQALGGFGG